MLFKRFYLIHSLSFGIDFNFSFQFPGQFSFDTLAIDGNLITKGLINGMNLSEISPKLARIDGAETVIESDVIFTESVRVHENIDVTGTVNDVDFKKLFDSVLRKTGSQTLTGHKTFKGNVTVTGNVDVKYINGIDWEKFLEDVVWINKPQVKCFQLNITKDLACYN